MSESAPRGPEAAADREVQVSAVIEAFARLLRDFDVALTESLNAANRDCTSVGEAFHRIAAATERLRAIHEARPRDAGAQDQCSEIIKSLDEAVVGMQYQDRLTQRIAHVCAGLNSLRKLLEDAGERPNREWLELLEDVERAHRAERARLEVSVILDAEIF